MAIYSVFFFYSGPQCQLGDEMRFEMDQGMVMMLLRLIFGYFRRFSFFVEDEQTDRRAGGQTDPPNEGRTDKP